MRDKWIKNFFFLAFLSVPFQNGTVLFTCGKNYEIWNISENEFFGVWCVKYWTFYIFDTSIVNAFTWWTARIGVHFNNGVGRIMVLVDRPTIDHVVKSIFHNWNRIINDIVKSIFHNEFLGLMYSFACGGASVHSRAINSVIWFYKKLFF